MNTRAGVIAGGNWIVDQVKIIDGWPPQDMLATIVEETLGNGGSAYNVLKNLARLGAAFPLEAIGLVGDDERGRWIAADCRAHAIDLRQLQVTAEEATSYTDVMTVRADGRRTFFHRRGANARLGPEHFDFAGTPAQIFHLGYLLLLDRLDLPGADGAPLAAAVLAAARRAGLATSLDLVSGSADRFPSIVLPTLPHVDYLFANDIEAAQATGIPLRKHDRLDRTAVERSARKLLAAGVGRWVIVHFPEGVYALDHAGSGVWQASVRVPPDQIKGAAGAGDALAAGVLFGLHEAWPMPRALSLGAAAAASSLMHPSCSEGVRPVAACLELAQRWGLRTLD